MLVEKKLIIRITLGAPPPESKPTARETTLFFRATYIQQLQRLSESDQQTPPEISPAIRKKIEQYLPEINKRLPLLFRLLNTVHRWEGSISFDGFHETDAGHIIGMLELAMEIEESHPGFFTEGMWGNVYGQILFHDFPEVLVNDVSRSHDNHAITTARRHKRERAAVRLLFRMAPSKGVSKESLKAIEHFLERYEEREAQAYDDGHFVKFLDTYQGNQMALAHFDDIQKQREAGIENQELVQKRNKRIDIISIIPLIKNGNAIFQFLRDEKENGGPKNTILKKVVAQLNQFVAAGYEEQVRQALDDQENLEICHSIVSTGSGQS
jgi:5'-deoxynucleotidase YfbR-like HD superfamily hydrolase